MGIKSLIQMAVTLAILAVATGKLPLILKEVRKAQLVLLWEPKASRWPELAAPSRFNETLTPLGFMPPKQDSPTGGTPPYRQWPWSP
jgi:hypothetical protein